MSVRILSQVWESYDGDGSELLVLLALADWCDDDGRCFPSIAAIGHKARLSRSQVQRVMRKLMEQGVLVVIGNEFGGKPGTTRQYRIVASKLTGRTGATGVASATGRTDATGSVYATGRTGATEGPQGCDMTGRIGAALTLKEPSKNTNREGAETNHKAEPPPSTPKSDEKDKPSRSSTKCTLKTFLAKCRESREAPIPEDHAVFAYAEEAGIPIDFLDLAWMAFKDRHKDTTKLYADWRRTFLNAVRGNWFHIWFLDAGEYRLTTAGQQWEKVREKRQQQKQQPEERREAA